MLSRSQPAVTQSLRKLEEILGCRLVERTRGHVGDLTDDGQRFLAHARELLARASDAVHALKVEPLKGRVRIGVPDDFEVGELNDLVAGCMKRHPGVRVEVRAAPSAQLQQLFDKRQLDLALIKRIAQPRRERAPGVVMRRETLRWVHQRDVDFGQFDPLPLVAFGEGCAFRRAAIAALDAIDRPWYLAYSSTSYANVRSAIACGLGFGVLPAASVDPTLRVVSRGRGIPKLPASELALCVHPGDPVRAYVARMITDNQHKG